MFGVVLAAVPAHITLARHQLTRWLGDIGVSAPRSHDIVLAVNEAVTNAIEHGSSCDASKVVSVHASAHADTLTATVSDSGRWIHSPPPATPTQRGRGLILIRALANNVEILRTALGTQLTMQFDVPNHCP
jgi:anti-sigma regulatory factor (Ser/Thr protein kinase)